MKQKIVAIPLLAATIIFIIAYTTIEKSSSDKALVSANQKAEQVTVKKAKPQKKKVKIKPTQIKETHKESIPEKEEVEEQQNSLSPQDAAIRNVILNRAMEYSAKNKLSTEYCFLIDMSLPSGRNRFFVYDLKKKTL